MATPHRKPVFFPSVPGYLSVNVYLVVGIEGSSTNTVG